MTVEVPPAAPTSIADQENETTTSQPKDVIDAAHKETVEEEATAGAVKESDEPTLSIQIEPPNETKIGEELMPSSSTEEKPKRKGLFNNPFNKSSGSAKKDSSDEVVTTTGGEKKITKGFGNFLSKVKVIQKGLLEKKMDTYINDIYYSKQPVVVISHNYQSLLLLQLPQKKLKVKSLKWEKKKLQNKKMLPLLIRMCLKKIHLRQKK